ncbi:DBH-like monooxygenase protein 2 homolog [Ruditapes philippinarum]|uniref:DBH-like monooxygenase protein 2 homolog n=1 Tax=Ruditapes philippinarum TaxID=129788 RepID=UPI00295B8B01|nr:DBH-like monooxygenase protein 2 homolog [Ruditapes philippinarum]
MTKCIHVLGFFILERRIIVRVYLYDSSQRQRPTVGGWTEYDELCRGYMLYYPRKPIEGCMSWNNYDKLTSTDGHKINGTNVFRTLVNTNWKDDRKMRNILRQTLDKSLENAQCWTSSPKREISYAIDFFRQPRITKIYKEPQSSTCQGV